MQQKMFSSARLVATVCAFSFILSGCLDDIEDVKVLSGVIDDDTVEMTISGSVGDGPIVGGAVIIRGVSGLIIAEQISDEFAHYVMEFSAPRDEFPLLVTVDDGTDLVTGAVPDFPMIASILSPGDGLVANLNPMGTVVVKIAQRMNGGLSAGNLAAAGQIVGSVLNFGLDTVQFPDSISTEVNDDNIANVVRSSEAFGESIRRTRDALLSIGHVAGAEQILDALSADLIDGVLDGRGAAGVDSRITVVNNIVSAQVALETMANRLTVGGIAATNAIDLAIGQVTSGRPTVALTDSLVVSDELLIQARVLLDAAIRIDANPALTTLRADLDLVAPGQFPHDLPSSLLNGTSDALDATSQQVSVASMDDIEVVNDAVREGFDGGDSDTNQAPTISGNPVTEMFVGSPYAFTPTVSDGDGDSLSFVIVGKPSWASFDPATGRLSGTPVSGEEGSYAGIRISVSDGVASTSLSAFAIAVTGLSNEAPAISGTPSSSVTAGVQYEFTPIASDPDDNVLSFSIIGKPAWANFDQLTGRLWGTPNSGELGDYPGIRISVSDGSASATLSAFTITVNGLPNGAPTISGSPSIGATVGSAYSFTPTASDPNGDALTFSVAGKPSWASFNTAVGRLSGTPGSGDVGSYSDIRISVSDGSVSATLSAFTIMVSALPNGAPTISGSPPTGVTVDSAYSFTPTASDPNGDVLTFSIAGKPSWASFNSASGRLSGTPGSGDAGGYSGILISVSDGGASASLSAFTITVSALPNGAPTIGGTPASQVIADSGYSFTPTASDPDGDALTFSISGRPSWATFTASTGRLSGTPGAGDVGTYTGIQISVTDGADSVSLGNFSIEVIAQALGSATLSWDAPTQNEDGSTLTDLAGFKVYYGTSEGAITTVETINNPTVTIYLVENLTAGSWFFKVTAFDTVGNESADSTVAGTMVILP